MPSTISVHFCLSWAISLAFSKVRFSSWSSFWTAPSHVVFGLPLGRLTFRMPSARACFAGASSGSLNRWPIHSSLFFWTFLLHSTVFVLEYRSLFDIFFGHAIFKIYLNSDLWKLLMSSASFFVRVQSSALYKKMLSMYALEILTLLLMVNLLLKAIFNLLKARMAKYFHLEISLLVSSKVPRYLHFFQLSFPPRLILCSSVFVSLTCRLKDSSWFGIRFLTSSILWPALEIQLMSSAYWRLISK